MVGGGPPYGCSAVPQMLGIGLRCVLFAHEQADDPPQGGTQFSPRWFWTGINSADVVLLDSYKSSSVLRGLQRAGFAIVRQKGSHARLEH